MGGSSIFDLVGPIIIGPSSSHTAGCARLGYIAQKLLGGQPQQATITFYNSFAHTYQGHGSDRAVIGGLLNYQIDDLRIRNALQDTASRNLQYTFKTVGSALNHHPNTLHFSLKGAEGATLSMLGVSTGGGKVCVQTVNGFDTNFSGALPTLIVFAQDVKGHIAFVTQLISHEGCNIATMTVARKGKNDATCLVIEMDTPLRKAAIDYLQGNATTHACAQLQGLYN